jgi:hypothetical protein
MANRRKTQNIADRIDDAGERTANFVSDMADQTRSMISRIDEATIPDAFRGVPKVISPRVHAWLDAAVVAYFVGVAGWCAIRTKFGAMTSALVNAGMVAGVSLFTDYDGDGKRPINFKLHGTLDVMQAATAAAGPFLHGFADEPEAALFYGQAVKEVAIVATTDWDAGMPSGRRRKAA